MIWEVRVARWPKMRSTETDRGGRRYVRMVRLGLERVWSTLRSGVYRHVRASTSTSTGAATDGHQTHLPTVTSYMYNTYLLLPYIG